MTILILIFVLISCFKRPMLGLALLLQMNIIRSLVNIDFNDPCFNCNNSPDVILGAVTPILGFLFILLGLDLKRHLKYVFDIFDGFFLFAIFTLFFTTLYATNFAESIDYSFRFLFLGIGVFYISKIILINSPNFLNLIKSFLLYNLWLAIVFGTFGGLMYLILGYGQGAYRMTIPGVHPIPFSQLIGLGIFTSFLIFITNGTFFQITSKVKLNLNKLVLPYLTLLLLATQTRGVMLSLAVAIMVYITLSKVKIRKRVLYVSGLFMCAALIVAINYIDFEVLFERLLAKQTEKSVDDRFVAYYDSLNIFLKNPFGIGPDSFKYYSILPYPHNLFLELLSQYGIFGLFIGVYLILLILYKYMLTLKYGKRSLPYIVLLALFFYFFIETMFSFTLWMHRGMYIAMGFFAGYHYMYKKSQMDMVKITKQL